MKNNKVYRSIKFAFYAKSVCQFSFSLTIVLVLQKMMLDGAYIASAFSVMTLVALVLDIPMGVFADRFSYRSAVLFAGIAEIFAYGSFLLSTSAIGFVYIGFLCKGISTALESGSFRLLLLDAANNGAQTAEENRKKFAHDIQNILRFASISGVGIGLYILKFSAFYPLVFGLFFSVLYTLIVATIQIDHYKPKRFKNIHEGLTILKEGFKFCVVPVQLPLLFYCIIEGFRNGTDQPAFSAFAKLAFGGEDLLWTLAIISFVVRTPSNWISHRLRIPTEKMISFTPLLFSMVGVLFFIMGKYPHSKVALFCIIGNFIIYSFRDYWFENWQARNVSIDPTIPRATALSALSFVQNLAAFLGTQILAAGSLLDKPQKIYSFCGLFIFFTMLGINVLSSKNMKAAKIDG